MNALGASTALYTSSKVIFSAWRAKTLPPFLPDEELIRPEEESLARIRFIKIGFALTLPASSLELTLPYFAIPTRI